MSEGFKHEMSLEIGRFLGLPIYWYGAVYTIGFVGIFGWLMLRRDRLGWTRRDVAEFTILLSGGLLVGGRLFDIAVYELDYYRAHPGQIINFWAGGLATHGVLLGGTIGAGIFCFLRGKRFLAMADEVVVPCAFLFGVGRIGNFIEGGVVGAQTLLPWGVIYANLDGARHPVALYEAAKNLIIVPILILVLRRYRAGRGVASALFIFLYALLRFFVDQYRDYESYWMGMGKGQFFNLVMAACGLVLLIVFLMRADRSRQNEIGARAHPDTAIGWLRSLALVALFVYPLGIPTSWTRAHIEDIRKEPPGISAPQ